LKENLCDRSLTEDML